MDYKNMTDEELEREYNRQMMVDYLRQRKAQKIKARGMLIGLGVIFLIIAVGIITAILYLSLTETITIDIDNDGYYEVKRVFKFMIDEYKANYPVFGN